MKNLILISVIASVTLFCTPKKAPNETAENEISEVIQLIKAPLSPEFKDAKLNATNIDINANDSAYLIDFAFEVTNYALGRQTEDAATRGIANSDKGQHIHLIINNEPYSAHYEPAAHKNLPEGNYVALAFLSRSYHESVKNGQSFVLANINAGNNNAPFDETSQHLFYSRPKGSYKGPEIKNLLLDFFLINTELSADGNKIRATINGEAFMIDEWVPYYIKGLSPGELTVKLELLDVDGNAIEGPYNVVERKVTLTD